MGTSGIIKKIVLIDDESRYLRIYCEELREEFEEDKYVVISCRDLWKAYDLLSRDGERVAVIILDVFMPPGELLKNRDVKYGAETGLVFYRKIIREELNLANIPVIFLTNLESRSFGKSLKGEKNCTVLAKCEILPFELCEKVRRVLKR